MSLKQQSLFALKESLKKKLRTSENILQDLAAMNIPNDLLYELIVARDIPKPLPTIRIYYKSGVSTNGEQWFSVCFHVNPHADHCGAGKDCSNLVPKSSTAKYVDIAFDFSRLCRFYTDDTQEKSRFVFQYKFDRNTGILDIKQSDIDGVIFPAEIYADEDYDKANDIVDEFWENNIVSRNLDKYICVID